MLANLDQQSVFSVSQLNATAKNLLGEHFPSIWIEGELSNFACPSSGHMYFSLKDSRAQVRCAFFKGRNRHLDFTPEDGMQVLLRAEVSLFEGRGEFQLLVQNLTLAGDGQLRLAYEQLKNRLQKQGLFAAEHKQPIPPSPQTIGIITSATGAAIRDMLSVLKRRYPLGKVIIYPTAVQGETAAQQIITALTIAEQRQECDVLVLTRGGGSLEDLWCFNDEHLAQQIFACSLPIVSAVGHEIDFTIADFVADVRAPTPSAAAELISPDQQQWSEHLQTMFKRLTQQWQQCLREKNILLQHLQKQLRDPKQHLREQMQRLDYLDSQLRQLISHLFEKLTSGLQTVHLQLLQHHPQQHINQLLNQNRELHHRLQHIMQQTIQHSQQQLGNVSRALNAVSPLATLERGYAIVTKPDKKVVRKASQLQVGETIHTRLGDGKVRSRIESIFQS